MKYLSQDLCNLRRPFLVDVRLVDEHTHVGTRDSGMYRRVIPFSFGDHLPIQYMYTVFASGESSWQLSAAPRQRAGSQRKGPLFIGLDAPPRRCCIGWCKNILRRILPWPEKGIRTKIRSLGLWNAIFGATCSAVSSVMVSPAPVVRTAAMIS